MMIIVTKGGKGSGNFGHTGRPGEIGGSTSGGGSVMSTINRLTLLGGDIGNVSFSDSEKELLSKTVQGDYTLYRGMHIMDFRLAPEQFEDVRNLRPGDPAPDFLTKQGNPYASYTKSPAVANRYASEGHVQIVIRVQPPKNKIVADTTNLHKLPEFANLMDQETRDYFRGEKEVIVHEPVRAIIFSISGPKAIHPGKISEKQIVVTKGGKGSGNFGHGGRPGEVGGSSTTSNIIASTPNVGKIGSYDTWDEAIIQNRKADAKHPKLSAYNMKYPPMLILPDDKVTALPTDHVIMIYSVTKHNKTDLKNFGIDAKDVPKDFGINADKDLSMADTLLVSGLKNGLVRIRFGGGETNIQTGEMNTRTLRRLQRLYDSRKLKLESNVVWDTSWGGEGKFLRTTLEDFLSAKHGIEKNGEIEL